MMANHEKEEFAEFILNMRSAADLTREDVAHHLCLSLTTLDSFERAERMPKDPAVFEKHLREFVKQAIQSKREIENIRYQLVVEENLYAQTC